MLGCHIQVDGKLMAQNQAPMTQAERAVAVRKLVAGMVQHASI